MVQDGYRVANVLPFQQMQQGKALVNIAITVVRRVLEQSVKDRISDHLERQRLIRDNQQDFVKGREGERGKNDKEPEGQRFHRGWWVYCWVRQMQ